MEILDEELEIYSSPDIDYWKLFIGPNPDYYLKQWQIFERQDRKISFHVFALLFNVHWLAYRKMYKYAIGSIIIVQFLTLSLSFFGINLYQSIVISMLPYAIFGLCGNWLYYKHAQEKIAQIKQQYNNAQKREQAIKKAGQTNPYFPILLIICSFALSFLTNAILGRGPF